MRNSTGLYYFHGDYPSILWDKSGFSTSIVVKNGGLLVSRQTYYAFGQPRTTEGSALPTDYTFTGQKSDDSTGLMYYGARYYDTGLGRFTQADTIVPNPLNPQSLNRYAYVSNNPVRYTDPTGHYECDGGDDCTPGDGEDDGDGGGNNDNAGNPGGGGGCGANTNDVDCDGVTDSEDQAPADTGGNQYPNGKECWPPCRVDPDDPENQFNAVKYDGIATALDAMSIVISGMGIAVETTGCIGGTVVAPGPGTAVGCGLGLAVYQLVNVVETLAGALSFGATAISDYYSGDNYLDVTGHEMSIGMDTVVSGIFFGVGTASPEAFIDTVINGLALGFDVGRLTGLTPDLGPIVIEW